MKEHHNPRDREAGGLAKPRILEFDTLEDKARWLDAAASFDASLGYVRKFADRFVGQVGESVATTEPRARAVHRFIRDTIHYVQDWRVIENEPGEEFADTETILRRGYDDCDGKSRAFVALCRCLGIDARIRPVFTKHPLDFVHVQAEVRWPGSEHVKGATPDGWCLAEMILKGCEIGMNPDDMPRDKNGKRMIV